MGYDVMANDSSAPNSAAVRDASKKRRGNRSAKLKQCKREARREQWLSQVKENKAVKATEENAGSPILASPALQPPFPRSRRVAVPPEMPLRGVDEEEETEETGGVGREITSDLDSPWHSSQASESQKRSPSNNGNGNSLSSGSSLWSSSRSVSDVEDQEAGNGREEDEEEENDVLDDWEAVADALSAENSHECQNSGPTAPSAGPMIQPACDPSVEEPTKPEPIRSRPRAWRPDDECRPQSLPSISKQVSFPASMGQCCVGLGAPQNRNLSLQSSCPICYEDLDTTDSSFLPCPCGFRLCLFCHKKILEEDGRCPGCRKKYEVIPPGGVAANGGREMASVLQMRLSRSCSMGPRC